MTRQRQSWALDHIRRVTMGCSEEAAIIRAQSRAAHHAWLELLLHILSNWGQSGRKQAAWVTKIAYKASAAELESSSFASFPLHSGKNLPDFCFQVGKFDCLNRFPRMQDKIERLAQRRQMPLHCSTHAPANAVSLYGAAQSFAHGKTHASSAGSLAFTIKSNHVSGKMLSALLVNSLKISMLQQA
jgi:hypothetical protein